MSIGLTRLDELIPGLVIHAVSIITSLWVTHYLFKIRKKGNGASSKIINIFLPLLIVIAGLVVGAAIGLSIAFSACFKSDCSPIESSAALTLPAASLLFTVPLAKKLARGPRQSNEGFSEVADQALAEGTANTEVASTVQHNDNPITVTDQSVTPQQASVSPDHSNEIRQ